MAVYPATATDRDAYSLGTDEQASGESFGWIYVGRDGSNYLDAGLIVDTPIPEGATILSASISAYSGNDVSNLTELLGRWRGYLATSVALFSNAHTHRLNAHDTLTTASVTDNAWSNPGSGNPHTSPSLVSVIQEIVDQSGFAGRIGIVYESLTTNTVCWFAIQRYEDGAAVRMRLTVVWQLTGSGAVNLPALTASGSGTFTSGGAGTFTGSGDVNLPALTASGAGTFEAPVYTGAGSVNLPTLTASGTGAFSPPVYTGEGDVSLPGLTASGAGTFEAPVYTGEADVSLPAIIASGSGQFATAIYSGTGNVSLPALTASGAGTFSPPIYTGEADVSLPALTAAGIGAFSAPVYTGSGTISLPALTAAGIGVFSAVALLLNLDQTSVALITPVKTIDVRTARKTVAMETDKTTVEVR